MTSAEAVSGTVEIPAHRTWSPPARPHFMRMNWIELLFMHWPVSIEDLRSCVPQELEIDTYQGQAWLSVVPFRMTGVAPRLLPDLPRLSAFPELNVRTYVTDGSRPGVWFFSLDASSRVAVRAARWLFHLPYMDARIEFTRPEKVADSFRFRSRRVHRGAPPAELDVEYRPVGERQPTTPGTLNHWLTARYIMYMADNKSRVFDGEVDHVPWQLQNASVSVRKNSMTEGLGIGTGLQPPVVHYSDSLKVIAWSKRPLVCN